MYAPCVEGLIKMNEESHIDCFYQQGMDDYFDGDAEQDCPYPEGTDGQWGWLKGWKAAEQAVEEAK